MYFWYVHCIIIVLRFLLEELACELKIKDFSDTACAIDNDRGGIIISWAAVELWMYKLQTWIKSVVGSKSMEMTSPFF